jgi:hypothetical protein
MNSVSAIRISAAASRWLPRTRQALRPGAEAEARAEGFQVRRVRLVVQVRRRMRQPRKVDPARREHQAVEVRVPGVDAAGLARGPS